MAGKSASILVKILGDESGFKKSLGGAGGSLDTFAKRMDAQGKKMQSMGTKMTAGLTLPLVAFGAYAVKNFMEAEKAQAQLEASLKSTGATAWTSADQIGTLADSMQEKYAIDNDLVKSGASLLLTFTSVRNEAGKGNDIFDRTTQTALDLSRKLGMDLPQANMLLGKALNDPIKGMGTLRKAGVQLTQQQQEQVRAFVAVGDTLSAQKVILGELETQFAGSAEAYAQTTEGQLEAAKLALEDVSEEIGAKLVPVLTTLGEKLVSAMDWFSGLSDGAQTAVIAIGGIAAAAGPILTVAGTVMRLASTFSDLKGKLVDVGKGADGTGRSFSNLGRAGQALTFAAGIIGVVALANALNGLGQSAERTQDLLNTLKLVPDSAGTDEALGKLDVYGSSLTSFFDKINRPFNDDIDIGRGATASFVSIKTALENLAKAGEWDQITTSLKDLRQASLLPENADKKPEIDALIAQYEGIVGRQQDVEASSAGAADGIEGTGNAAEDTGTALESAAPGFETFMASMSGVKTLADALSSTLDELFGPKLDLEAATSAWEEALDSLSASIQANGTTLDITTEKGRANRETLVSNTQASWDLMNAEVAGGMSAEEAAGRHKMRVEALIAEAVQSGMTEQQVRDLIGAYGDVPPEVITKAQFDSIKAMLDAGDLTAAARIYGALTPAARAQFDKSLATPQIQALMAELARIPSTTTTRHTFYTNIPDVLARIPAFALTGIRKADGGVIDYFANGGMRENHVAQIAAAGAWRVWAEPETGGEAYIPLAPSKRKRSIDIWAETGRRLGLYADGAVVGGSAAGGSTTPVVVNVNFNGPVARDAERWVVAQVEAAVAKGVQLPKLKRAMA